MSLTDPRGVWALRTRLRDRVRAGQKLRGTFVKLPTVDVLDMAAGILDLVVIDLEHSTLSDADAITLLRHARAIALPALVRVATPDSDRINHFLEAGAVGIQLSMLTSVEAREALLAASRYAPHGQRSISMAHPTAAFGAMGIADYLAAEQAEPPILVGQIESEVDGALADVVSGLDVAFVGTTDLAVSLGLSGQEVELKQAVAQIAQAAEQVGVGFGGWVARPDDISGAGLDSAAFVLIGSDLQVLFAGIRDLVGRSVE